MAYKPREPQIKVCKHCSTSFESHHKNRIYCSQSCNTLAWMKRRQVNAGSSAKPGGQQKVTLDFSAPNLATMAAGVLAADGIKDLGKAIFGYKSVEEKKLDLLLEEVKQLTAKIAGQASPQHPANRSNLTPDQRNQEWQYTGDRISVHVVFFGTTEFLGMSNGKTLLYFNKTYRMVAVEREKGNYVAMPYQDWLDQIARIEEGQKQLGLM